MLIKEFEFKEDFKGVYQLFYNVWFRYPQANALALKICTLNYMLSLLRAGTAAFVAYDSIPSSETNLSSSKQVVGFYIVDDGSKQKPFNTMALSCVHHGSINLLRMLPHATLERMVDERYVSNYQKLSKLCPSAYKNSPELLVLLVDSQSQGKGVGKQLIKHVTELLRKQGHHNFKLRTDEGCNYRFYEHLNLECVFSQKMNFAYDLLKAEPEYLRTMIFVNHFQ